MYQVLAPAEAETVEQQREHLEMVVLFVAHHINHLVNGIVVEAHLSRADVLRHIDAGAIAAQQQFLVQPRIGEVGPHRAIVLAEEETLVESLLHLRLSAQVGLALIVYLVKRHSHLLVSLVEAGIHPAVHLLPQGAHLGVVLLPLHQHLVSLLDEGCLLLGLLFVHAFGHELLHLLTVVLVEQHVVVANEVVALLATRLRRLAVTPLQPCQHRLADVYATVVDDVRLHHAVAIGLHDFGQAPTQQVVAHMAQVQRFVGVRTAVFNHHEGGILAHRLCAELLVLLDGLQQLQPGSLPHAEVEEALHHVILLYGGAVLHQVLAYLLTRLLGRFPGCLHKGEDHQGEVSFKLATRLLQLQHLLCGLHAVKLLYGFTGGLADECLNLHIRKFLCKGTNKRAKSKRKSLFLLFFRAKVPSATAKGTNKRGKVPSVTAKGSCLPQLFMLVYANSKRMQQKKKESLGGSDICL